MKYFLVLALALCLGVPAALAQQGEVSGTAVDATTGEPLPFANVLYADGKGVVADFDGNFSLVLDYGSYTLTVSYAGLEPSQIPVKVDRKKIVLGKVGLKAKELGEVQIVADIADRATPVAYSNIPTKQVEEELAGGADLPMVLNSTPSVYATQAGGGDGDARINIRGFSQRNIAVMLDGVPVNDMENGWVYWSNWSGLDVVLRSTQVQRGLSASKIAIPAVGGSMNLITKGIEAEKGMVLRQEITNFGYRRTTVGLTTGKMENGWGVTFAGSRKWGSSWVDGTFTDGWFYFLKLEKKFGNHLLSVSGMGAPQSHGQRSFKAPVPRYSKEFAREMFVGSDEDYQNHKEYQEVFDEYYWITRNNSIQQNDPNRWQDAINQLSSAEEAYGFTPESFLQSVKENNFIDTAGFVDRGIGYNRHWGTLRRYDIVNREYNNPFSPYIVTGGDTTDAPVEEWHERVNYYHKPQFTLRDFWQVSDKLYVSNVAYLSVGSGGGTGSQPSISDTELDENGQIDVQSNIYDPNRFGANIDTRYSETERRSSKILRSSINSHFWYGLLSTINYQRDEKWNFSTGLDMRSYRGIHYREVYDLVGGDYFIDDADRNTLSPIKRVGDKYGYSNDGVIRWFGSFAEAEYKGGNWSGFANISGAYSAYYRIDYFRRKDLIIDGDVYSQAVGAGETAYFNGSELAVAGLNATVTQSGDTLHIDNTDDSQLEDQSIVGADKEYTNESDEARYATTEWNWFPSYTAKAGINYLLSEKQNVFMNVGFINKAPRFANVYDNSNQLYNDIQPEKIRAVELGYSYRGKQFTGHVNAYYTSWQNQPVDIRLPSSNDEDASFNINGLSSLHTGIEFDTRYQLTKKWKLQGVVSLGDWKLNGNAVGLEVDQNGNPILDANGDQNQIVLNAKGVPVGDAAQSSVVGTVRFEPVKRLYLQGRITYFGRHYANWNPGDYDDSKTDEFGDPLGFDAEGNPKDPWKIPNYYLVDGFAGYGFKWREVRFNFRVTVNNVLNRTYISDATNNDFFNGLGNANRFDAASAAVFFGQGRRLSTSLKLSF